MSFAQTRFTRCLNRKYQLWGVDVTFRNPLTGASESLKMVETTKNDDFGDNLVSVSTLTPSATVRYSDLTAIGVTPSNMVGVSITMNGTLWTIQSHGLRPCPFGAANGEVSFKLVSPCL